MSTSQIGQIELNKSKDPATYSPAIQPGLELDFLEHLTDGVMVLDTQTRVIAINQALTRILGWESADMLGKPCAPFLGCQDPNSGTPLCQGFCPAHALWLNSNGSNHNHHDNQTLYRELSVSCKDGSRREVSVSHSKMWLEEVKPLESQPEGAIEVRNGQKLEATSRELKKYTMVVMRDITERSRLERIKTQFLVTASHQLRTPLSAIKASIGLLLDNVQGKLDGPLVRLLQNIQNSSLHIERLVNDLIELANLQSGMVQLQNDWLEVNYVVQKAIEASQERLKNKGQPLEIFLPQQHLFVRGDSIRLTKILSHLLANASKFSPPGSPIKLKVTAQPASNARPEELEVVFSVSDQGQGIPYEEQQLVFEKFYQSEVSENADGEGIGLGLPLARALVELHRGRMWLESETGQGSNFYFALPTSANGIQ
jgi:signal transduction histidine kinase